MMLEALFLLLPVAALSGWWMANISCRKKLEKKMSCSYEPEYYKGLNFLLNEQPDKAIDVFINLLEVDSETVETHLALGSLFRKRGEVDRAIRIHQNLVARETLSPEQRSQAEEKYDPPFEIVQEPFCHPDAPVLDEDTDHTDAEAVH